jgi:hypothetical protein
MLARQFKDWVDNRPGVSPLYDKIVGNLIKDRDLLQLISEAGDRPFIYNLFMGAAHYLVLETATSDLSPFYGASPNGANGQDSDPYPHFRDFCFMHKIEILNLVTQREVQINEVRRCAVLVPALAAVSNRVNCAPLALLDVGACAGLNLNFDRYFYDYGVAGTVGPENSTVRIASAARGQTVSMVPRAFPSIPWRLGIDSDPVDVTDSHAVNWLVGLVSPDDRKRMDLLKAALSIARQNAPQLLKGKAVDVLTSALSSIPDGLVPCIFHSFTTHHFSRDELKQFDEIRESFGQQRELYSISLEWQRSDGQVLPRQEPVPIKLTIFSGRQVQEQTLAMTDNRGGCDTLDWLADTDAQC